MSEQQTGKTLIRLIQSDLGLHCLSWPFWQATSVGNFRTFTGSWSLIVSGLYLMGFKPQSCFKKYFKVKPAQFIYPDETVSSLDYISLMQDAHLQQ